MALKDVALGVGLGLGLTVLLKTGALGFAALSLTSALFVAAGITLVTMALLNPAPVRQWGGIGVNYIVNLRPHFGYGFGNPFRPAWNWMHTTYHSHARRFHPANVGGVPVLPTGGAHRNNLPPPPPPRSGQTGAGFIGLGAGAGAAAAGRSTAHTSSTFIPSGGHTASTSRPTAQGSAGGRSTQTSTMRTGSTFVPRAGGAGNRI